MGLEISQQVDGGIRMQAVIGKMPAIPKGYRALEAGERPHSGDMVYDLIVEEYFEMDDDDLAMMELFGSANPVPVVRKVG